MKEKLFYWISFTVALMSTIGLFIVGVCNDWVIIEVLCGIFAIILGWVSKVIKKKTAGNLGHSKVVYDREKDGQLCE